MTREQVAATVVARALQRSGASADLTYRLALGHDPANRRLSAVVPSYERTGKSAIVYWVRHSIKGLDLSRGELHDDTTWSELVRMVVGSLTQSVMLFKCTDTHELHFYTQWGAGTCRIDGTPLEQVT